MKIVSVAIGEKYEIEVERLKRSLNGIPIEIFTRKNSKYKVISEDNLVNGLYHKSNFANYIDSTMDSIVFIDADAFTLNNNPFESFVVNNETDFAYVPYKNIWFLPDEIRQNAFDFHGHKINSGFMYFKNLEIAKIICSKWSEEFLKRPMELIRNEYDEWALMIALEKLQKQKKINVELLPSKWNDWELTTLEEHVNSKSIFMQSHHFLDIV